MGSSNSKSKRSSTSDISLSSRKNKNLLKVDFFGAKSQTDDSQFRLYHDRWPVVRVRFSGEFNRSGKTYRRSPLTTPKRKKKIEN